MLALAGGRHPSIEIIKSLACLSFVYPWLSNAFFLWNKKIQKVFSYYKLRGTCNVNFLNISYQCTPQVLECSSYSGYVVGLITMAE